LELSLKDYFLIIFKKWKILLAFMLAGLLLMFFWSYFLIDDKYEISTTSSLLIDQIEGSSSQGDMVNKEQQAFNRLVSNFEFYLVEADTIFDNIWEQNLAELYSSYDDVHAENKVDISFETEHETVGEWAQSLGYSKKKLKQAVDFSFWDKANGLFKISITVKDPQFGVVLMAAYNLASMKKVSDMSEPASADVIVKAQYHIIDQPHIPDENDVIRPNITLNMFLGALVGIILAICVILIINHYDVKIKNEDDIREKFDVPVIAVIPDISDNKKGY